jgi:N-acetylmuramoyl-L-alanine amidase
MRSISHIVIHCTATQPTATVASIQRYWREQLQWRNPGYHRLVDSTGKVHKLLDFNGVANGVAGHNQTSIHISYIGGIDPQGRPVDTRNIAQKAGILAAIREALNYQGIQQGVQICGHRDFPNVRKACPSFDARAEYRWITI